TGLVGAALSFGPALPGYSLLYDVVPVLQGIRAVARFVLLPLLATGVLAAFGLASLRAGWLAAGRSRAAQIVGVAAVVVVNAENARAPMAFVEFEGVPPIYAALAQSPEAVVAEFPFPEPARITVNARAVQASTRHWRPLVNGYSGYIPRSYVEHYLAFASFPAQEALDALRRVGVTHVVVDIEQMPGAVADLQQRANVRLVAVDARRRIYAIAARANQPPPAR
ncbi:MAG TPA: hypothetical protein VMF13_19870, partial [Luteitalea sp.]|nr:hypothetical protein [Luteitalea sp.]